MVIKGNARGGAAQLAKHLGRKDTNERVELRETRGVAAEDLVGALKEMDALGAALKTDRTLYHASINVRSDEHMTDDQWTRAIDRLEEKLGLTGQPRVVVEHGKKGREHVHVVWSRTDLEHMRAIRCDHNFRTHEEVARELEKEFGHARVQGVHVEREGPDGKRMARPKRTPSHAAMMQADRSGLSAKEAKEWISTLWRATDSGQAFHAALENQGWTLARGDRRDFVVLDPSGGIHSLSRLVEGVTAKDVRARMAGVDRDSLFSVADAREVHRHRLDPNRVPFEAIERPLAAEKLKPPSIIEARAKNGIERDAKAKERADLQSDRNARILASKQQAPRADRGKRGGAVKVLGGVARKAGSLLDSIASIVLSPFDAKSPTARGKDEPANEKEAQPMPPAEPPGQTSHAESVRREEQARSQRMAELLQKYSRVVTAENDLEPNRDRDRER